MTPAGLCACACLVCCDPKRLGPSLYSRVPPFNLIRKQVRGTQSSVGKTNVWYNGMFLIKVNQSVDNKRTFHWRIWSENKKQGIAFTGSDFIVICYVFSLLSQNRPLLFEMGRIKMFKDFLLLPAPLKGHKSNVIIPHNCGEGNTCQGMIWTYKL